MKSRSSKKRADPVDRRAFTLVEVLVVIGIIALLVALLLPTLGSAHRSARQLQCLSNLHQLGIANQIYQQEFSDRNLPAFWGWSPAGVGWNQGTPPTIAASDTYHSWANIPTVWETMGAVKRNSRFIRQMICPDATLAQTDGNAVIGFGIGMSYGINNTSLPGYPASLAPDYFNDWKRGQVHSPAEKIQFVDAIGSVSTGGTPNPTMRYFLPTWGEVHYPPDHSNIVAYRHHRGACALFYDGHAAWQPVGAMLYDPTNPGTLKNKRQWSPTQP